MSEPKRAALTSIDVHNKDKKPVKCVPKTYRFALTLTESNEKSCPIFNYRELLDSAAKKNRINNDSKIVNGGSNLLGDDDDSDVQRIAKEFEAKYGAPTPKKRRKKYKGDYADVGAGYDESDSFIDNTDAYDEIVPEDLSPLHGGFYINSGSLEFKQQEISELDEPTSPKTVKGRKRVLELEDSDDDSNDKAKNLQIEKKVKIDIDSDKNAKKKVSDESKDIGNVNSNVPAKKKVISDSTVFKKKSITVKDLLKEKREDLDMSFNEETKPKSPKEVLINSDQKKIGVISSTSINDAIESVVSAGRELIHDESSKDSGTSVVSGTGSGNTSDSSDSSDEEDPKNPNSVNSSICTPVEITKLPDNLPDELIQLLDTMKKASSCAEGKRKFFSESVNSMLLRLEFMCRGLKTSVRSQVYDHLSLFVRCKKETLIRRAKRLVLDRLNDPMKRLKECIEKSMPSVIENYQKECQRVNEKKLAHDRSESPNGEKPKQFRLPKRKFHWNDVTRKILSEIIAAKRQFHKTDKIRKENFYQFLERFYKEELVLLWPEGWMSPAHLFRESMPFLSPEEKPIKLDKKAIGSDMSTTKVTAIANKVQDTIHPKLPAKIVVDVNSKPLVPLPSSSLSIKPVIQHSSSIKNNLIKPIQMNSGLTIEPIPNKPTNDVRQKMNSPSPLPTDLSMNTSLANVTVGNNVDPLYAFRSVILLENIQHMTGSTTNSKTPKQNSTSRNTSPIPNTVLDLNTKKSKIEDSAGKRGKPEPTITVKKLSDLMQSNIIEINSPPAPASNQTSVITSKAKLSKESKSEQLPKDDSDVEIIEIRDDDLPTPMVKKPGPKSKAAEMDAKMRYKAKKKERLEMNAKVDTASSTERMAQMLKYKQQEAEIRPHGVKKSVPTPTTGSDLISQIITDSLANSVSISRKGDRNESPQIEPAASIDVMQVMKDLKALQEELTGPSDKSRDTQSCSPVSVIPINTNRQQPTARNNSVSPTAPAPQKPGGGDVGFQEIFQKHLYQETKDCASSTNHFNTSPGKVRINSNSLETYPFIGSTNSTTILPVTTSHKYPQNVILASTPNLPHIPPQAAQHTGPAQQSPPY